MTPFLRSHLASAIGVAGLLVACSDSSATDAPTSTSTTTGVGGSGGTSASGAGGVGGTGGTIDHGMPSDVYPAFHPVLPTILQENGSVLEAPEIVPVYFTSDDTAITNTLTEFTAGLGATSYWADTVTEYGVGPATSLTPIVLDEAPGATIDDSDIQAWLAGKLNSNDPAFPAPDANSLFLLVYPEGTTITIQGLTSCVSIGAFHGSVKLDAAHGSQKVAYGVIPRCPSFQGLTGIDVLTAAASHEIIEASTDPIYDEPAYDLLDPDHVVWQIFTGYEVCDLCDQSRTSYTKFPGFDFTVERCWSNAAAALLHDPCVPADSGAPYFNSAAVLPDELHVSGLTFPGLNVPVGETRDLEIDLFSEAPTSGPWTVTATDLAPLFGGAPELDLALDRDSGVNGEKLHLAVTAKKAAASQFSLFVLKSKLDDKQAVWVVPVGND